MKKGITLVALVVTIAILLILAGISLNLVLGNNGIIERAQLARNKTIEDQANTTKQLKELSDELGDSLRGGIKASQIPEVYYVGGTLTSGVVISDNAKDENKYEREAVVGTELEGNQYVWVPCTTDSSSSKLKYARTTDWSDSIEADNGTPALKDELTLTDSSVTYIDSDTENGINANVSKEIVAQIKAVNFDTILATGLTTAKSNIFDMGGNVSEYTTEINPGTTESEVLRGGYDNYSLSHNFSAGYRWDVGANYVLSYIGFRATLFLK